MAGACAFCPIVKGTAPAHVVVDDARGHGVPRRRVRCSPATRWSCPASTWRRSSTCPAELIQPLFGVVRILAAVVEGTLDAAGSFVAINNRVSQSVPHLHVHVVPRPPEDGLRGFFWPRTRYDSDEEAAEIAARWRRATGRSPADRVGPPR